MNQITTRFISETNPNFFQMPIMTRKSKAGEASTHELPPKRQAAEVAPVQPEVLEAPLQPEVLEAPVQPEVQVQVGAEVVEGAVQAVMDSHEFKTALQAAIQRSVPLYFETPDFQVAVQDPIQRRVLSMTDHYVETPDFQDFIHNFLRRKTMLVAEGMVEDVVRDKIQGATAQIEAITKDGAQQCQGLLDTGFDAIATRVQDGQTAIQTAAGQAVARVARAANTIDLTVEGPQHEDSDNSDSDYDDV